MNLISLWDLRVSSISVPPATSSSFCKPSSSACKFHFPFPNYASRRTLSKSNAIFAKRGRSESAEPRLKPNIIEQVSVDEEEQEEEQALFDEFDDEIAVDDASYFEDEFIENETDLYVGDGGGGGGIKLGGTWWDKEALAIAEDVCQSFDGQLKIYAFKTLSNSTIQVRIERLTNKSGSPSLEDIQAFSLAYRTRLDEAEFAKTIPDNISLEVSSPGVERVVLVPQELDRFKDRPVYVKYANEISTTGLSTENDGVFRLVSFDMETKCCTWGLADVRINREKAGKGRPLSKKQREWRLTTTFDSLRLVRLYSDI